MAEDLSIHKDGDHTGYPSQRYAHNRGRHGAIITYALRKRHRPACSHDTYIKKKMLKKTTVDQELVFKQRAGKK